MKYNQWSRSKAVVRLAYFLKGNARHTFEAGVEDRRALDLRKRIGGGDGGSKGEALGAAVGAALGAALGELLGEVL